MVLAQHPTASTMIFPCNHFSLQSLPLSLWEVGRECWGTNASWWGVLNWFPDWSWWPSTPAFLCFGLDRSKVCSYTGSHSPAELSSVDNYGNYFLVSTPFLGSFPSLTHSPILPQVFPKVTSQVYSWHANLCPGSVLTDSKPRQKYIYTATFLNVYQVNACSDRNKAE